MRGEERTSSSHLNLHLGFTSWRGEMAAAPGLAVAAYVPGILFVIPFLSTFAGYFLDLVLLGCMATSLWHVMRRLGSSLAPSANRVTIVAFVLFVLLGYHLQESVGLSGDEPHYLLVTYSLLNDGDLAVENNYGYRDTYGNFNTDEHTNNYAHTNENTDSPTCLPTADPKGLALY